MGLYSRRQLALLLLVIGVAGVGMAAGHWRRAHPGLAERLESFDHAPRPVPVPGGAASPAADDAPVHLNHAGADELTRLPGVGSALAARIVAARPFASVEDLRRVRGLGGARLDRLRPLVTVGD
jgi:competence protein ComEA